jgi:hypothetical protein
VRVHGAQVRLLPLLLQDGPHFPLLRRGARLSVDALGEQPVDLDGGDELVKEDGDLGAFVDQGGQGEAKEAALGFGRLGRGVLASPRQEPARFVAVWRDLGDTLLVASEFTSCNSNRGVFVSSCHRL